MTFSNRNHVDERVLTGSSMLYASKIFAVALCFTCGISVQLVTYPSGIQMTVLLARSRHSFLNHFGVDAMSVPAKLRCSCFLSTRCHPDQNMNTSSAFLHTDAWRSIREKFYFKISRTQVRVGTAVTVDEMMYNACLHNHTSVATRRVVRDAIAALEAFDDEAEDAAASVVVAVRKQTMST